MIIIDGRRIIIPKTDSVVGFQGDNLVETKTFELIRLYNNIDLSLLDFKLDIQNGTSKNIIDLTKEITDDKITLTWTILEAHLVNSGLSQIQVRGFNGTAEKWHSDVEYITIKQSINASEAFPDPLPSEFKDLEIKITEYKNIAADSAATATKKAQEATDTLTQFNADVEGLITVGTVSPTYGLWLEEV